MTIHNNMTPAGLLQFAARTALVGLAASQSQAHATRALLQNGTPPGSSLNPPPTATVVPSPPPVSLASPPPGIFTPPPVTLAPPPAPVALTPPPAPATVPPQLPVAATPPGAGNLPVPPTSTGVPTMGRSADPACQYGSDHGIVEEYALSCYLGCAFQNPSIPQSCLDELSVQPGPNPQPGMVWCPFTPETQTRIYVTAEDCSNDCHSAAQNGIQGTSFGFTTDQLSVCQAYDDLAGAQTSPRPSGITGSVTMNENPAICLDTMAGSSAAGTTVNVFHCDGQPSQQWVLNGTGPLTSNGMCLDIIGGTPTAGAFLEIAECNGGASQNWDVYGLTKQIISRVSNGDMCVDTLGKLNYDYISAVLAACDTTVPTQQWNI